MRQRDINRLQPDELVNLCPSIHGQGNGDAVPCLMVALAMLSGYELGVLRSLVATGAVRAKGHATWYMQGGGAGPNDLRK